MQQQQQGQNFDQKPIGQGQKMPQLSQYPPDFNPSQLPAQPSEPLPLRKRLFSKVWKIRKQALQQLFQQVSQQAQKYTEFLKDSSTLISDSNPVCQQRALRVLLKYLQTQNVGKCIDQPRNLIKVLIEKCLVVQKGQIANLTSQIMFWMMEQYQQILINQLNQNMLNKNPRICVSVIGFLEVLVNNYGAKKLKQFEEFGKNFTILSSSVRPIAKQQTINLFKQMYRWMGQNALAFQMHPQVKDQVIKFTKSYVKQPMAIKRGLNQDQKKGKKPIVESMEDEQNQQPQDVLLPYDSRWVDKVLQQPKWKDKKAILDEFIKKTRPKNIIPRQSSHYITLIKRLLSDNNINLLQCGFKIVKNLSVSLKKNFTHPCKVILSPIFSKLRDTKAMIVDQALETLEAMMNCLTVEDMTEDIKQGLKDKAPNMRFQVLRFVQRLISKRDKKMMAAWKNLSCIFVEMNQDGASQVRDKALDVLCKLKAAYGINFFGDKLKKLQDKKLQTIQNYIDPNSNQIQEQIPQNKQEPPKKPLPKSLKTSPIQQNSQQSHTSQPSQPSKFSHISQPIPKVTPFSLPVSSNPPSFYSQLQAFSSNTPNFQQMRMNLYQNLYGKTGAMIHQELIEGFKSRGMGVISKESNPALLKILINCVKKAVGNGTVGVEHLEVLTYHDWKKCKSLLTQFIQSSKLSLPALEYTKTILSTTNSKRSQPSPFPIHSSQSQSQQSQQSHSQSQSQFQPQPPNPIKHFHSSLQSLIPKMSNPDPTIRLQAASTALHMLKQFPSPSVSSSSGVQLSDPQPSASNLQAISQLFNVLKYRIQDSNEQIANSYIEFVTEMLVKGLLAKYRTPGRILIGMLLQRIGNSRLKALPEFVREMAINNGVVLWGFLVGDVCKEMLCGPILGIIRDHSQSFFKSADQKAYMLPLLTNIGKDLEAQKCGQLLDQIVQINGQQFLQKMVRDNKLSGYSIQSYLKKWHIQPHKSPSHPPTQFLQSHPQSSFPLSKLERIALQLESTSPPPSLSSPTPSQIIKLINTMISLGQPFQQLAAPILLSQSQLSLISSLPEPLITDFSDIWTKWLFWRIHMETYPQTINSLLSFLTQILTLTPELHQSQLITLMSTMLSLLYLHFTSSSQSYLSSILDINSLLNANPLYRERAFRFWINCLGWENVPVQQVLKVVVGYGALVGEELVTLARYPAVLRDAEFNRYLRAHYTEKLLGVYGFGGRGRGGVAISEGIVYQQLTEIQSKYFLELFQKCSSNEIVQKIIQQVHPNPSEPLLSVHLKIIHSIAVPYLNRQIPFINIYNYFKYLQKILPSLISPSSSTSSSSSSSSSFYSLLLSLTRCLSSFLIDLDEAKLENYAQLLKSINKILLVLLEIGNYRDMLRVLFEILRDQLQDNKERRDGRESNAKLLLLLPKCIGKIVKSNGFKEMYKNQSWNQQRGGIKIRKDGQAWLCLEVLVKQFVSIIQNCQINMDSSLIKTFKNLLNETINMYPDSIAIFEDELSHPHQKNNQKITKLLQQIIKDKTKQNKPSNPLTTATASSFQLSQKSQTNPSISAVNIAANPLINPNPNVNNYNNGNMNANRNTNANANMYTHPKDSISTNMILKSIRGIGMLVGMSSNPNNNNGNNGNTSGKIGDKDKDKME